MIGAIVKNDIVESLLIINIGEVAELSEALDCEIVDARPYGLCPGDLRTPSGWTRNAGGEQIVLPLLDQEQYDSYSITAEKNIQLEEENAMLISQQTTIAEATADEALAILSGEVEE